MRYVRVFLLAALFASLSIAHAGKRSQRKTNETVNTLVVIHKNVWTVIHDQAGMSSGTVAAQINRIVRNFGIDKSKAASEETVVAWVGNVPTMHAIQGGSEYLRNVVLRDLERRPDKR